MNKGKKTQSEELDDLLKIAQLYTQQILQISTSLHAQQIHTENKENGKMNKGSKRRLSPFKQGQSYSPSKKSEVSSVDCVQGESFSFYGQPRSLTKGCELQPHQIDCLKWMIALYQLGVNGILADDMGMGKTIQSISMIAYLHENSKMKEPHLIVAPKSTIANWMREFAKWTPFLKVVNLNPTMEHREDILKNKMKPGKFDVCVTTYEALKICGTDLQKYDFHMIFFDEAHKLKNDEAQVSENSRKLYSTARFLLTGTPLMNNVSELWSLLNFLMPNMFKSKDNFSDSFNFAKYDKDQEAKISMVKKLHKIMKPFMLRRTKDQLINRLPAKIEMNITVQLSQMQIDLYYNFLCKNAGSVADSSGFQVEIKSQQNLLMQLRKICNHPYLFEGMEQPGSEEYGEHIVTNSGKFILMDKLIEKIVKKKEQVLIFSCFTTTLNIIEDYCEMRQWDFCRLDGTTSLEDREEILAEFVRPKTDLQIFLISTRAGGLGLNLYTANHVILFDSDWNPQIDLQAMDRCHRIGQKKEVYVYRLMTQNTIEEKIIERQAVKLKLDQVVIQQGNQATNTNLSKEDYEKVLFHGAAKIMQMKNDKVVFDTDSIDIDKIIQEGIDHHKQINQVAENNADEFKKESSNTFDFDMQKINSYMFQNKDYKDEQKVIQDMLKEQQKNNIVPGRHQRRARIMAPINEAHNNDIYNPSKPQKEKKPVIPKYKEKVKLVQIFDHNFNPNVERIQELTDEIQEMYENLLEVPDEVAAEYEQVVNEGFPHWRKSEYDKLIMALKQFKIDEYQQIAEKIESKSTDQVQEYIQALVDNVQDLKEKDVILQRLRLNEFDEKNIQTMMHHNAYKHHTFLLQENQYLDTKVYLKMLENKRLIDNVNHRLRNGKTPSLDISIRMNHLLKSQMGDPSEYLKAASVAIRAEQALRQQVQPMYSCHNRMKTMMLQCKLYKEANQKNGQAYHKYALDTVSRKKIGSQMEDQKTQSLKKRRSTRPSKIPEIFAK